MPESEGTEDTKLEDGVSVIVPCYYDWERVKPCLDAIRKQTGVAIQLILVYNKPMEQDKETNKYFDGVGAKALQQELEQYKNEYNNENENKPDNDKSSCVIIDLVHDKTIAKQYENKYNRKYQTTASAARNIGLDYATKKTLMFIDDDDVIGWQPGKSEIDTHYILKFYNKALENNNVAMITGDRVRTQMEDDGTISVKPFEKMGFSDYNNRVWTENNELEYKHGMPFLRDRHTCCATLFRTELINDPETQLRFDPDMRFQEDSKFVMQYALKAALNTLVQKGELVCKSESTTPVSISEYVLQPNTSVDTQVTKKPDWHTKYISKGNVFSYTVLLQPVALPEIIAQTIVKKNVEGITATSFYANIEHNDSVMGLSTKPSNEKLKHQQKRDCDDIAYCEWCAEDLSQIESHNMFTLIGELTISEWCKKLNQFARDINAIVDPDSIENPELREKRYSLAMNRMQDWFDVFGYANLVSDSAAKLEDIESDISRTSDHAGTRNKIEQFKEAAQKVLNFSNINMQDIANIPQQDDSGYEY